MALLRARVPNLGMGIEAPAVAKVAPVSAARLYRPTNAGGHAIDVTAGLRRARTLFGDSIYATAVADFLGLDLEAELLLQSAGHRTPYCV